MDSQSYTYIISKDDTINAVRLRNKPQNAIRIAITLVGLFYLLMFFAGVYFSTKGFIPWQTLVPAGLIPGLIIIFRHRFLAFQVNRHFKQQKELHAPIEIEITEDALMSSNEYASSKRPWRNFSKWKEDDDLFLLYHSDALQTLIPKRIFSHQVEVHELRQILSNNIAPREEVRPIETPLIILVFLLESIPWFYASARKRPNPGCPALEPPFTPISDSRQQHSLSRDRHRSAATAGHLVKERQP